MPIEAGAGPNREPLFHHPAVTGIEAVAIARGNHRVDPSLRKLDDEVAPRGDHREDPTAALERRRAEASAVLADPRPATEGADQVRITLVGRHHRMMTAGSIARARA